MSAHNLSAELVEAVGPLNVGTQQGKLFYYVNGAPSNSISGYAKGCLAVDTNAGKLYINTGSKSSATWTVVGSQS